MHRCAGFVRLFNLAECSAELTLGLCVDVPGGVKPSPNNPAPQLQLWQCTGGPNQEWDPVCE